MIGSLSVNTYSPVVPVVVLLIGLLLLKPGWFRVRPRMPFLGYAGRDPLMAINLVS